MREGLPAGSNLEVPVLIFPRPAKTDSEGIWSIACFFVVRRLRRRGITPRISKAAAEQAGSHGASIVEAYPEDPDSPSYRFLGFVSTFEKAGFCEVGRAGTGRHVLQLHLKK